VKPVAFEVRQLRDIVTLEKGKPPVQQPYLGQDAELYLTPEYLRGKAAAEPVKPGANAVRVLDGDIIVLWDGSNAGEFFRARKGILASTMSRIGYNDAFDKGYFFYAVKNWEAFLKGQTSGSGIPHVDKEVLGRIAILQFARPEQTKIADILSTVDLAIEQTEALIAKQQRIKTGSMQDLLTRGIDEHGNLRSEPTHQFKDSPVGRIPVEWEVVALGSVSEISSGITLGTSYSGPNTVELPYLRVANVQDGYLDLTDVKLIRIPKCNVERYELRVGDVLMNEGGDFDKLGRGCVWNGEIEHCLHQNHVFKVRPKQGLLASDYLAAVSSSPYGKSFFVLASKQSTNLASINSTQLKSFPIPLPEYCEQLRIEKLAKQYTSVYNEAMRRLSKLRSLKTALMQDLLTGKVRVTPLLDKMEVTDG
jgi:type I restriction enzyme S subunit